MCVCTTKYVCTHVYTGSCALLWLARREELRKCVAYRCIYACILLGNWRERERERELESEHVLNDVVCERKRAQSLGVGGAN